MRKYTLKYVGIISILIIVGFGVFSNQIKNQNSLTDKRVLIFRDSYQAPMTWLLADIFKEVQIIDPRYIENIDMTYEKIITTIDSDIVMFMYNSFEFEGMIKEMIGKTIN